MGFLLLLRLEHIGKFCRKGSFTGTLQTGHHKYYRRSDLFKINIEQPLRPLKQPVHRELSSPSTDSV
jgi:hypothetical protein